MLMSTLLLTWQINICIKLFQLKKAGVYQSDLVRIFVTSVHPAVEYVCPVWPTGLPRYLSDSIEVVQKRAIRCTSIYPGKTCNEILDRTNLPTLVQWRSKISKKYFHKIEKDNHKLYHMLPHLRPVPYNMRTLHHFCVPSFLRISLSNGG